MMDDEEAEEQRVRERNRAWIAEILGEEQAERYERRMEREKA